MEDKEEWEKEIEKARQMLDKEGIPKLPLSLVRREIYKLSKQQRVILFKALLDKPS
jgi:hypothetical protein